MRHNVHDVHEGSTVYSSDGAKLGKLKSKNHDGFTIEKGVFFKKDYIAKYSEISDIRDDQIYLAMSEKSFYGSEIPSDTEGTEETKGTEKASKPTGTREEVRVPLAKEHLEATKRTEESGRVRVRKETVTEEETVKVPVTHEEVRVERVPTEGASSAKSEGAFQGEEVVIPVYEEKVEVTKKPEVTEEVRVSKELHRDEETRRAPVRKERAVVDEEATEPERRASELEEERTGYKAPPPHPDDR